MPLNYVVWQSIIILYCLYDVDRSINLSIHGITTYCIIISKLI